ncbi:MAG: trypsin-like peptidase domain-containing protein, partial [Planctomycetota bacterium]
MLAWLYAPMVSAAGPEIIGEHLRDTVLETPHPYPTSSGPSPELVWSDHYHFPEAQHLVFEFARFDLAPGDFVEVRDPGRNQVHVYRGRGFKDKGGDFITKMILGPEAYIDLYSVNPTNEYFGYRIERVTRGFSKAELAARRGQEPGDFEAICGSDDKEDAICYETEFPEVYERSRAVVRILMDGLSLCTGWLVSCQNHLMTNNHCTWDDDDFDTQGELDRMEFQFIYQEPTCGGDEASYEYSFMSGTWLENDNPLDYTLIQAPPEEDPASTYGWLLIDYRLAEIDELMYIIGHPDGRPKEISLYSTHSSEDNPDGFCEVFSVDEPACTGGPVGDVGYYCDTEGGSSGSPVLSRDTNKVIALHHCAFCPNRGVRIQNIWDLNQAGPHALPACSILEDIGSVELDRERYGCSDTVSIEVNDGSLQGTGFTSVTIWSDTEPFPQTVPLVEDPHDSGTFTGSIATTTAVPTPGDGLLSVADGDGLTVRYIDADDGQGGSNVPRTDTAVVDCLGPLISNVEITDVAGATATVLWSTDEPADSRVFFGTSPPDWSTAYEPDLVLDHAVELTGLLECTDHYYWVRSTDEAGNPGEDDNGGAYYTFETGVDIRPTYNYPGLPLPIQDFENTVATIPVAQDFEITDLDVWVNISHSATSDLDIYLRGPSGLEIALSRDNGGSGDDYAGTFFDDEAATPIDDGSPPFAGSYRPEVPLSTFDGLGSGGNWALRVYDDGTGDTGTLISWSLTPTFPPRACGPHASYKSHALETDLCGEGGLGHEDGTWDAGEEVTFRVRVTNDGTETLTGVQATVTALTPGATMTQDTASYGDLAAGEAGDSQAPHFTVQLPATLFCADTLDFQVDVTSNEGSWSDGFSQTVGLLIPGEGVALDESFDLAGIPADWTVIDGGETTDTWFSDDASDPADCSNTDPLSPIDGTWAAVDSDC